LGHGWQFPTDFCFEPQLAPRIFDQIFPAPILESGPSNPKCQSSGRRAQIHTFFYGPEKFFLPPKTATNFWAKAPEVTGYWVAAGYKLIGNRVVLGAGMALAQMDETMAKPPFDLWESRYPACAGHSQKKPPLYARARDRNTGPALMPITFPIGKWQRVRGAFAVRPLHEQIYRPRGAVFVEVRRWERGQLVFGQ